MRKFIAVFIILAGYLCSCINNAKQPQEKNVWGNAKWISYERLPEGMIQVPAVHGDGNELGDKCIKKSIAPMFRKEFELAKEIENANISICGLGHYELSVNGEKTGDRFLAPGWTKYEKRCLYNKYDITNQLITGKNAIGVLVGNGFYNINRERYRKLVVAYGYPKLIFNIKITYKDGTIEHIISDDECRVMPSPITFSSIYGGEDFDARLNQKNWNKANFDDAGWNTPIILDDKLDNLSEELEFPVKIMQEFEVKNISTSETGGIIYDFGQNASGIISLKVKGNEGAKIHILPGELLDEKGNISQKSSGGPYEFNYTLSGKGIEEWQPRFSYYGFRYAQVEITEPENAVKKTELLNLKMLHTRNSAPTVGTFSCSDTLFNQIFELINWSIKSNMSSVTTDCPHREKLGWLEVTHLMGPSIQYNYDIHSFYEKIVFDMMDSQTEEGLVPDIAPEYVPFGGGFRDSPEWGSASVIIPWQLYQWYGNKDILSKAYPMMIKYLQYLQSKSEQHILDYGLGDWFDLGPNHPGEAQLTPKALTATAIYFYDLKIMSQIAQVLDISVDAEKYAALSNQVQEAFLNHFYSANTGLCSTGSQTAYAMPLSVGLIPEQDRAKVFANLTDSIIKNNYALTAGDIGYHYLVEVLSKNGRSDILYKMNSRTDIPGYGYQLKKGATSLTESWAALPRPSNNHMMLGHLMEWFYSGLGGIQQADNSIAYSDIKIAPKPVGNIKWVKCSHQSSKGLIQSNWTIEANTFTLEIEIPENSSAQIVIPKAYSNSSIKVMNTKLNTIINNQLKNGTLKLPTGKYKIVAVKN